MMGEEDDNANNEHALEDIEANDVEPGFEEIAARAAYVAFQFDEAGE